MGLGCYYWIKLNTMKIALGIEGSANKLAVGVVTDDGTILSNLRDTFITPPGTGFKPNETAVHHRTLIIEMIQKAMKEAKVEPKDLDVICYTKGPGMGGPLNVCAITARVISQLWKKPLVGVNHCVAHIEMGRIVTSSSDPVVVNFTYLFLVICFWRKYTSNFIFFKYISYIW